MFPVYFHTQTECPVTIIVFESGEYLADRGLKPIINQAIRTMLHSRLTLGLQRYKYDDRISTGATWRASAGADSSSGIA